MKDLLMTSPSLPPTSDTLAFKVGDVVNLKGFKYIKMIINAILPPPRDVHYSDPIPQPNYQVQLIYANDLLNFIFLTVQIDCIELHQEDD